MIPVEKNKEYIADITAVSSDGNGICRIDGYAVFVPQTVTGDKIRVLIVKVNSGYGYGKLIEIIEPSPYRCEPVCGAYKRCGGCQMMHINYEHQLEIKKGIVENAMQRIGGFENFKLSGIYGADVPYRYRNKMIFPVGEDKSGEIICGFYAQRSHDIMPLDDCLMGGEFNGKILGALKKYMRENNVSAYNEKLHKGLIRRVFTRVSRISKDVMVVVSANGRELPHTDKLISAVRDACDSVVSIILNINTKRSNNVLGAENITLFGADFIRDTLCGIDFEISPHSFFQINPEMTHKLYNKAIELASLTGNERVMDIYCGIGTISLCAAKKAQFVTGVEIVEAAIKDAKKNAQANGILNAEFYASSAEDIVPKLISKGERPDVVILDPPRKGSDEKTLTAIADAAPEKIVYVSCNPATLARDVKFLCERGYALSEAYGFDMFPNTVHCEVACALQRQAMR